MRQPAQSRPQHRAHALLLDVGNSRLKWALLRGQYRRGQRFAASGALELAALRERSSVLQRLLASLPADCRIYVCNVAGAPAERQLRALVRGAGLQPARFVRSARVAMGVHNAYGEPWRLGADRWARLIGARHEYPRQALCIVAAGTAMTIDLLDSKGRHRGGNIIPGPQLMIDSLLQGTAGIRRRAGSMAAGLARARRPTVFARDTRSALLAGAAYAAAGLVAEAMRAAQRLLGRKPRLLIAGGAVDAIARLLPATHHRAEDLALRGLAVLCAAEPSAPRVRPRRAAVT
jgi:type III pantothenate kinase